MSTAFEEKVLEAYRTEALDAVRTEHAKYFEALEKHPRLLVGTRVPSITGEGDEVLGDTNDAREWQEAVKSILVDEVRDRADKAVEENASFLDTIHASIELFTKNNDLMPGTKDFDVELANRFAEIAAPYELRTDDGKLQGYSIPVQPIIDQLRTRLVAERASKAAAPAAPASQPAAPAGGQGASTPPTPSAAPGAPAEQPQAGIPSKAGQGDQAEDFSALFGTIGLPDLRI